MVPVFLNLLYILVQAFLLLFSAAGWAHWLWRLPAVLVSAPLFPKYAFAKLLVTFTLFWVLMAIWGCYETRFFLPPSARRPWMRLAPAAFLLAMIGLALVDDIAHWRAIIRNAEPLATVNTPMTRRCYKYAEAHKEVSYIVVEDHPHLSAWLAYACRGAKTYVITSGTISDLIPVPGLDTFSVVPPVLKHAVILSRMGVLPLDGLKAPVLNVAYPQGTGTDEHGMPYSWLGFDPADMVAYAPFTGEASSQWDFPLEATPIFPTLDPDSDISLTAEDGSVQVIHFREKGAIQFPITSHGGINRLQLRAIRPTIAENHVSNDPRRGVIYLQQVFMIPHK